MADFKKVLKIVRELHRKASFKNITNDDLHIQHRYNHAVLDPSTLALVVEDSDGKIYGVCIAQVFDVFWGNRITMDVITYSNKPGWTYKLLKQYKNWALKQNVEAINVGIISGPNERYEKLIEKLGFKKVGSTLTYYTGE